MPELYLVRIFFSFLFLGLFRTAMDGDALVFNHMGIHNNEVHWNLKFYQIGA
jgi:hypothetical protein